MAARSAVFTSDEGATFTYWPVGHKDGVEVLSSCYMIIEPDLITFPTYKIYPELDIGELEEIIYYDDEVIEYEPEAYFLGNARHCRCNARCIAKEKNRNCGKSRQN